MASMMAAAADGGGTKITEAFAPTSETACSKNQGGDDDTGFILARYDWLRPEFDGCVASQETARSAVCLRGRTN